jgi:hypothetical protein
MLPERMEDDGLVLRRWVVGDAEALHAVIAESASRLRPALALPDVRAVEIRHDKANAASSAVPRRLGYTLVGEAPNRAPAPADSGTDLVWRRTPVPQNLVLRLALDLVHFDRGGRRRPVLDGYRASMSFGQRRRGIEPVVHDAIIVLEHSSALISGQRGRALVGADARRAAALRRRRVGLHAA